jgi:hypothetical protein
MRRALQATGHGAATAAKALAVAAPATVAAVALTFAAAGPAVAATQVQPQAPATVLTAAAKVKYYVVPPPGHGSVPTLYSIAAATLGHGSRFMEIFTLNKGRLQPNGQRLEDPHSVEPGWILLLPPDASGPGVHFGPLPTTAKATAQVVRRHAARSQATPVASAAAGVAGDGSGAVAETVIGGALLVFAAAGLGLVVRRRRGAGGGSRRTPAHARDAGPSSDWVRSLATDTPDETTGDGPGSAIGAHGRGWPAADHPSWPANDPGPPVPAAVGYGRVTGSESQDRPYPDHPSWPASSPGHPLTPDHPSWPASGLDAPVPAADYGRPGPDRQSWPYPDHPSWPASDPGRPVTDDDDYPSWPVTGPGGGRAGPAEPAAHPGRPLHGGGAGMPQRERPEPSPAEHHDPGTGQAMAQVPPARGRHVRVPAGYPGPAGDGPQRWSAQLARTAGPIPQTYYDLAFGDGRLQVMLTETPGADSGWAAGHGARGGTMLQLPGPGAAGRQGLVSLDAGEYAHADSARLAERVLADADQQAAAIRQEATSQAVVIREAAEQEATEIKQQAAAEAAPIREAAEQEATEIKQQAACQVTAIREAAEREIAELRATVLAMSDELSRVATYVTESLTSPGQPATSPPQQAGPQTLTPLAQPSAKPAARPSAEPAAEPPAEPDAKPPAKPAARPAGKPGAKRGAGPATKPAGKPGTPGKSAKGRQISAMHKMMAAFAALIVIGVAAGSTQIALHGVPFFVFRANGAGASLTGLKEDQGPGQPDAPGTHHKAPAATPGATAKAHGHGAKAKGHKSRAKNPPEKSQSKQPKGQQTPKPGKSG